MASRPEAAYAAAEVTPKWVLISWHHLLPPRLMIAGLPRPAQSFGQAVPSATGTVSRSSADKPVFGASRSRPSFDQQIGLEGRSMPEHLFGCPSGRIVLASAADGRRADTPRGPHRGRNFSASCAFAAEP